MEQTNGKLESHHRTIDDKARSVNYQTIRVSTLVLAALSFGAGVVATVFVINALAKNEIALSAYDTVSFVFTVALGAAAIILAVLSINLSKVAEDTLVRRSDEGIRIQNEVFVRTSEVLGKIQTSTGVTERRIEDIIAGRTTSIATEVVEKSLPDSQTMVSKEVVSRLKAEIAESLKTEIIPLLRGTPSGAQIYLSGLEERQSRRGEVRKNWNAFREAVIIELAKLRDIQVLSEGRGVYDADESDIFWDAILAIGNTRIGLDIHTVEQIDPEKGTITWKTSESAAQSFLRRIVWRTLQDHIDLTFVVFDVDVWSEPALREMATQLDNVNTKGTRVLRVSGDAATVAKTIHQRVLESRESQP